MDKKKLLVLMDTHYFEMANQILVFLSDILRKGLELFSLSSKGLIYKALKALTAT